MLPAPPKTCINDVLVALKHSFEDHLNFLDTIFMALLSAGFQVNLEKLRLCQKELEFLTFWVTEAGHNPLASKAKGTMSIKPFTPKKRIKMLTSPVNFVKSHTPNRAKLMEPLTKLTKDNEKFVWKEEHRQAFDTVKAKCSESAILISTIINETFCLSADA